MEPTCHMEERRWGVSDKSKSREAFKEWENIVGAPKGTGLQSAFFGGWNAREKILIAKAVEHMQKELGDNEQPAFIDGVKTCIAILKGLGDE